ncbi:unannotated protein [freshwater metagenome]|uniref:Unannotated protein n=1 Tax=freshwater metagenome TaxID=449393 RepID=A0A6J6IIG6_9ZZZZ|nr:hypothetical protein [Actinomycetota bacterium]
MRKILLISTTLVASATLAGCALFYPNIGTDETPGDPMNPSPTASPSAPTESESPSASPTKELAKPRLLSYDIVGTDLQIIAEVVNFAEDGGECIITFYSGNTPVVMERVPAEHNVSTTQCFPLTIALSRLPKGIGEIVVGYESEKYEGKSEKTEVNIP